MLDTHLRPLINPILGSLARKLVQHKITPNQMTIAGFIVGVLGALVLMFHFYLPALVLILLSRIMDGLDGAIARESRQESDFGGYLDIVLDMIFYSAVIFAFALGHPDQAIYAAFLIFSFIGTGSSFLAYAILAEKRGEKTEVNGKKSFFHIGGLAEGTETILVLCLICLFPQHFYLFALLFGMMCWLTTMSRIIEAKERFGG